jgi:hypothetical protein
MAERHSQLVGAIGITRPKLGSGLDGVMFVLRILFGRESMLSLTQSSRQAAVPHPHCWTASRARP